MNVGSILSRIFKNSGDDVLNTVSKNYASDNISRLASSSADDIARIDGNLIATHQLHPDKLQKASELGGFVQPSMAVVDPNRGTNFLPSSGFGDIVMVANRSAIDPKRAASKAIIGDRDIYSPRFPQEEISPNMDVLDEMIKGTNNSRQFALQNLGLDDSPEYSYLMQELYRDQNPAMKGMSSADLRGVPEFNQFASDAFERLKGDRQYAYFTNSGAKKTLPATAENANKLMNKEAVIGGEKGWQTPYTAIYHQNTKKFRSLDDLYKNRYRLIDSNTGENTKDAMRDHMSTVIDDLIKENPSLNDSFSAYDTAGNYVADLASNADASWGSYLNVSDDLQRKIDELKTVYQQVPTSYFEAKPRRVVGGNEFSSAFIPESSPQEVLDQLASLGVNDVRKYVDPGDLDLQLSIMAKQGKRGVDPYVLGLGGILPGAGILSALLGGNGGEDQQLA